MNRLGMQKRVNYFDHSIPDNAGPFLARVVGIDDKPNTYDVIVMGMPKSDPRSKLIETNVEQREIDEYDEGRYIIELS